MDVVLDAFRSDFMRTAYLVGLMVGVIAPLVGFFLVERRMSLIGDGIGHVAFLGVAIGLLLDVEPVFTALVAAIVGAIVIELLRSSRHAAGDQALALLFYVGIAGGVVVISSAGALDANLFAYLFGSILTIDSREFAYVAVLGLIDVLVVVTWFRALTGVAIDEEGAAVAGVPVRQLNLLVAVLAGVTIGVSMRTVGILLISALMVLPVMAAGRVAWSLRSTMALACLFGVASALLGLTGAYVWNIAPGGTIVLVAAGLFSVAAVVGSARGRVR